MTVPASKRTKAKSEYANQARIVLLATRNLFRKWPKSRNCLETVHVMHIAYEMYSSACSADIIYASTVEEHEMKLQLLCKAQGMLNSLSGLVDDWVDFPPREKDLEAYRKYPEGDPRYNPVVKEKKFVNYAGTLYKAMGVFTGAVKYERDQLKKAKNAESKTNTIMETWAQA